ncbi:uncharacterized protein DMENIID0001_133460 [Sergentomyia squamirostris]
MLKQLIRGRELVTFNRYGAPFLVEKISKLSLTSSSSPSRTLSTCSEPRNKAIFVPTLLKIDVAPPSIPQITPAIPLRNPLKEIRDVPKIRVNIIEPIRRTMLTEINSIVEQQKEIKLPQTGVIVEKHAVRMIVIRRKKMKKHKLKKLRKKMKYLWAKINQRREMRKEKAFRAEIFAQLKEAESFSPEQYVEEKIRKATETPIPRFWKGRRLPQFIIKEKLGIK